jgi:S-formylglutathione hydrolase FrmB
MSRRLVVLLLVLLFGGTVALVAPRATASSGADAQPLAFRDAHDIHVVSVVQRDSRLWALSVSSPALGRAVRVDVLLPSGYADGDQRYPVLYLFHGTSGGPDDWVNDGDVEATTAGLPVIVVMPDAGFDNDGGGWFTNWVDTTTTLGPSQWETFHITDLVPWVDTTLRTVATRDGRAIAGLSQGGFGAFTYAARHPDLFVTAGSFSGAPDIASDPVVEAGATGIIEATAVGLDGVPPTAMFGSHLDHETNWKGHDPTTLVTNLRDSQLFLYTATGIPGPYDSPSSGLPAAMAIEGATHVSTMDFVAHAKAAGVPYTLDDYVFGTHTFPYWARDLREFVGPMMTVFAHPAAAPAAVSYESVDKTWTQWGWTVANTRPDAQAFSALTGATAQGFVLAGGGSATVTTPAFYAPDSSHAVLIGSDATHVRADGTGRLVLTVPLGDGPETVRVS